MTSHTRNRNVTGIFVTVIVTLFPARAHAQEAQPSAQARATLYTVAQAERGALVFTKVCSFCHGTDKFEGDAFKTTWKGVSVGKLYKFIRKSMPYDNPGGLTPEQYIDVVSYILQLNAFPIGKEELAPDSKDLDSFLLDFK